MRKDRILQIKIVVEGITPKIWRRFLVESNITLHQLHRIIQVVMGWTNSHLYSFIVDGKEYQDEKSEDFDDFEGEEILSSRRTKIDLLKEKQKFHYIYDFGDNWEHLLIVEKILAEDDSHRNPVCMGGERNCPPEDCGSVSGYYHLMDVRKNKKHPEYHSLIKEWLGEDYDPEYFNAAEVNIELQKMFPQKREKIDGRARSWVVKDKL